MEEEFDELIEINFGDEQAIIYTTDSKYKVISIFNIDSRRVIEISGFMMMMRYGIIFSPVNLN